VTWNEAITAGCHLAGVSYAELQRRLGQKSQTTLVQWRAGSRAASIINFTRILEALELSGGWDGRVGWWVARPEDVRLPKGAGQ
jgi:hypothetical protein